MHDFSYSDSFMVNVLLNRIGKVKRRRQNDSSENLLPAKKNDSTLTSCNLIQELEEKVI